MMEKSLNHVRLHAESITVSRAVFDVIYATAGKSKTENFYISHPDTCNLKDTPEHLKLKEYLLRWGIANEN